LTLGGSFAVIAATIVEANPIKTHFCLPRSDSKIELLPLTLLALFLSLALADAATLNPTAWGFFSDGGGGPIDGITDYSEIHDRVVSGYSSTTPEIFRGVYEFDLRAYAHTTVAGSLQLSVYDSVFGDSGPEALPFQLYGYIGDGQATPSDFLAGSSLSSFTISSPGTYILDVSGFLASATLSGNRFVGFNVRPNGDPLVNQSAYFLGSPNTGPTSSILVVNQVPEPNLLNFCLCGVFLVSRLRSRPRDGLTQ
jgi:hypothetical protein